MSSPAESPSDVVEVARTLAAHGGGAASFDLALDLVLNEVVEQARLQTGATGAAIALTRAGEMVCRATTGADAPDLGVRLETKSGLSGACLQTENSTMLGHRNRSASQCRGVPAPGREIDSDTASGRRERTLWRAGGFFFPAQRVRRSGCEHSPGLGAPRRREQEGSRGGAAVLPKCESEPVALGRDTEGSTRRGEIWRPMPRIRSKRAPPRRSEVWTSILGVLVILVAVLLGLALGWRAGIGRSLRGTGRSAAGACVHNKRKARAGFQLESTKTAPEPTWRRAQNRVPCRRQAASAATSADRRVADCRSLKMARSSTVCRLPTRMATTGEACHQGRIRETFGDATDPSSGAGVSTGSESAANSGLGGFGCANRRRGSGPRHSGCGRKSGAGRSGGAGRTAVEVSTLLGGRPSSRDADASHDPVHTSTHLKCRVVRHFSQVHSDALPKHLHCISAPTVRQAPVSESLCDFVVLRQG